MRLAQDIFALGIVSVGLLFGAWMLWDIFYGKEAIEARDNAADQRRRNEQFSQPQSK